MYIRDVVRGELVSTHSRPKAAGPIDFVIELIFGVSTHSRPKAAGQHTGLCPCRNVCFNTQPPEGGWRPLRITLTGV